MKIRHYILKMFLCVGGLFSFAQGLFSANEVTVHINSGNPKFPFPQFSYYEYGDKHKLENLGTKNPEGVVHAEMEQDIRDAYQIFANEWEYTGESWGGVQYIRGNIGCPYDCREGDGYSLLAAAVMGDKISFDGLWMCCHDKSRVKQKRYIDGVVFEPNYQYGDFSNKDNQNSATDGDVDIAIALYIAWRQWGDLMGIDDFSGTPISYKQEFINFLKGMVGVSSRFMTENPRRSLSGDIGFDGYLKNGDTWTEITDYATTNPMVEDGVSIIPEYGGPQVMHTDYLAPAYFHEFFELLDELKPDEITEFEKNQFKRCAASCDWVVGNWISQAPKNIFVGEEATIVNNKVNLEAGNQGGRFRSSWRTALNYMWHGNPDYTWDPVTHQVKEGGNTYEYDGSVRFSEFMNDPQTSGNSDCLVYGTNPLSYKGPATLHWDLQPDGSYPYSKFNLNWTPACGLPSAISAQDLDLAGILYRHCNIEWDVKTPGDGYLTSVPVYFHGWFRLLGLLVATGNHIAPSQMATPKANMKIYRSLQDSMSLAYVGDNVKYYLDYRNFGSVDAKDVVIVENVPDEFIFVSATDGGKYDAATHTVTWNIGTVAGVKSDDIEGPALNLKASNLSKTLGQVSYIAKVGPNAANGETKRFCTTAEITCSNGTGWVSNEYPNHITATMQRNCVDVINRSLKMSKKANLEMVNPGNKVKYTINFENSSKEGWLEGGRPRVNVAFCNNGINTQQEKFGFRLYSDAIEPYINYGNYRVSYFMYDPSMKCLKNTSDCPVGWSYMTETLELNSNGSAGSDLDVSVEKIVNGMDSETGKKWNQRLIIKFPNALVTTTAHLLNQNGQAGRVHKGVLVPLRIVGQIQPVPQGDVNYTDDWSWDPKAEDDVAGSYYPVTPSVQKIDPVTGKAIEIPVNEYLPNVCQIPKHTVNNILVEEYDGYVWRKILGNGPMAGREYENVVILDTLPKGMEFIGFDGKCPLEAFEASWDSYQIADGRWVVKWEIPFLQREQKGTISYYAQASMPSGNKCPTPDELTQNIAWLSAKNESPLSDTAEVVVTCAKVPDPVEPTTMIKAADKESYEVGDPISYEIEYEQTHGYVVKDAAAKASDWTGGSVSSGKVSANGSKAKYNYSYASNTYLEMDCEGYNGLSFYLRDNIKVKVRKDWAFVYLSCYEGSKIIGEEQPIVSNAEKFNLKVELNENLLRVWFDSDTSDLAIFTGEVSSTKPGYFSVEEGTYSNIYLHTDYAYDLTIVDRKPAEVSFVEADNGGVLKGDSIVWEFEHGIDNPIPFGTKYILTWKGTVDECSESIINVAYAKLLGHKDNEIMAQAVSGCGAAACPLTKASLKSDDVVFCETDSMRIKATVKDKGSYLYQWYDGKTKIGTETEDLDTLWVKESGEYWVQVTSADDATCTVNSDTLKMGVDQLPVLVLNDTSACAGGEIELPSVAATDNGTYKYEWSDGSTGSTLTVNKEGEYSVIVTNGACVAKDTAEVAFGSVTLKGGVFTLNGIEYDRAVTDTGSVCPDSKVKLSVNYAADGNVFEWSSKPAGAIADNSTGNEIVIYPTTTTTYYVRFKQECEAVDSFVVTIGGVKLSGGSFTLNGTEYPRSEGNTGTVCPGADNKLTVSYKSDDGVYAWSSKPADAALVSAGATTTISPKETTTYYVDFTLGCAARDSFVVEIGEPMKVEIVAEVGCNVTKLTASTTGSANAEFTWTKDGAEIKTNPLEIDGANNHFGTVSVVATAPDACPSEPVETTYLNIEPHVMIDGSATVCPGKTATLAAVITYPKEDFVPGIKPVDEPTSNTYSWSDGTSVVGTGATLEAPAGTYTLTVSDGLCEMTATHTIEEGTGEVKGDLTINGTKIVGSGAERTYGTCGGELEIVADYVHDAGTGFTWTVNGVEQPETGNKITLTPSGATTVKIAFQNECDAFDEFTITQIDSVRLTTAVTRLCGTTQLSAASETDGVDYVWTNAAGDVLGLGKSLDMKASVNGAVSGVAYVQGTAAGYCDSRKVEVAYAIDTLGVTLTGPESVCEGSTAELAATATASDPSAAIEYSYAFRKAGSGVFMPLGMPSVPTTTTPELAESTEIEVTATAGQCEAKATFTVKVAGSKRDGVLAINDIGISRKDVNGTKYYRTCGDKGSLELSVTHTGDEFVWTKDGDIVGEGRSVTITPTTTENHTEQYIVYYSNLCAASDTINIGIYPISAAADWSAFNGTYCEGDSALAELIVANYDEDLEGSYIKWYKDNEEQPQLAGRTSLEFNGLKAEQSGVYRYEVSNGICTRPTSPDAGSLVIRPRVTVGVLSDTLVVPRADTAELQVITVPEDAVVQWFEETGEGRKGLNVGNPYRMTITRDYQLTAVVLASGYCSDSVDMTVLADAHLSLNLVHSTPGVCKDGGLDTLSIDTSGTGKIYFPEKYVISIQAGTDSVHFSEVARNVTEYVAEVTEPTYFRAVINYGKHQAVSKVLKVRVYDDATFDVVYDRKVCVDGKSEIAIRNLSPKDAGIVWLPDASLEAKDSSAVATPPANHTYGFYIVQNNWRCQQKVTFEIETVPQLELELTDTTICQGGSANLRAQVFNGTAEGYRWYDSDGQLIAERSVQAVKPEETSTYTLKTTNGYCDSTSAEVTVTVAESPVITDIENMGKRETRVSVEGGLPPYEYAVYPHDYGSSEIVAVDRYGVNTYKVRDLNGCVATRLDTLEAPTIEIPVLVTPNNDGVKDLFEVPALTEAYPDSRIKIFDRWGKVLAEFKASDGGWDGTYNGKKMRADDYWYEIYIPELYKYYTGHFTLNNE